MTSVTDSNDGGFGVTLMTLPEIFAKNRYFVIPDYQRIYSWERQQVEMMMEDIGHLFSKNQSTRHYTGTLVFSKNQSEVYDVVDGQQRLTTLIILMACLSSEKSEFRNKILERYVYRGRVGNYRSVFELNSNTNEFFNSEILELDRRAGKEESFKSHRRLHDAKKVIKESIRGWLNDGYTVQDILNVVENRLGFIVYAPNDTAEVGIMFEVINNRGKSLSELEKVKNFLIYCCSKTEAHETRQRVDSSWGEILGNLHRAKKTTPADEGAFLRYCCTVHLGSTKERSQYGYEEVKRYIDIDKGLKSEEERAHMVVRLEQFLAFVEDASRCYAHLFGGDKTEKKTRFSEVFKLIRSQNRQASVMPLILSVFQREGLDDETRRKLFMLLEILNFRVYIAPGVVSRNDSGQARLFQVAYYFYSGQWSVQDLVNDLYEFLSTYSQDDVFEASFRLDTDSNYDYYTWDGLKYFLMNYEQEVQPHKTIFIESIIKGRKEGKSKDFLSLEHIWANNYRAHEGANDRDEDYHERRRLGNFVLLELRVNIQAENKGIEEKVELYSQGVYKDGNPESTTDLEQVRILIKDARDAIAQKDNEWKRRDKGYYTEIFQFINDRQEARYLSFARKRWSLKPFKELLNAYEQGDVSDGLQGQVS